MPREPAIERTLGEVLRRGIFLAVRLGDGPDPVECSRAAARGGLTLLEITLTTPRALRAIETLARDDELLVGAGTVLTPEEARLAAEAGARFVMSPVFHPEVVDAAHERGLLAVPGAGSAGEILAAHRHGARLVKVFPSGALGGPRFLRAVRGPFPAVPLVPTSGPTAATLGEYLDAGAAAVGVGADVFVPGFTPEGVEQAARALCAARDAWREASRR